MHGNTNAGPNRRKPLAPLPAELTGPAREFALRLRQMHGELGLSLKDLEGRLPASRSSLSRYLGGRGLPDERLLVQWCKLSFAGEDRLPELIRLLHTALDAASETAEEQPEAEDSTSEELTPGEPEVVTLFPRRRRRTTLAAAGAALAVAATATLLALLLGDDGSPGANGAGAQEPPPSGTTERITVNNVEKRCQDGRRRECALGLALDPYAPYRPSNIGGRVWHGDILKADCRIANGVTVTDESGGHSSIWYRVDWRDKRVWMPGVRIQPDQLQYSRLQNCPD